MVMDRNAETDRLRKEHCEPLMLHLADGLRKAGMKVEIGCGEIRMVDGIQMNVRAFVLMGNYKHEVRLTYIGARRVNRRMPKGGFDRDKILAKLIEDIGVRKQEQAKYRAEIDAAMRGQRATDAIVTELGIEDNEQIHGVYSNDGETFRLDLVGLTAEQVRKIAAILK